MEAGDTATEGEFNHMDFWMLHREDKMYLEAGLAAGKSVATYIRDQAELTMLTTDETMLENQITATRTVQNIPWPLQFLFNNISENYYNNLEDLEESTVKFVSMQRT